MQSKTLLLIIFSCILSINLLSQNIVKEGKVWSYAPPITSNGGIQQGDTFTLAFSEDSIEIEGKYYRLINSEFAEFPNYPEFGFPSPIPTPTETNPAYIREENNNKIFIKIGSSPETLKYDFSIQEGEYFDFMTNLVPLTYDSIQLISIDTLFDLRGIPRARYHFEDDYDTWIEGIGSIYSLHPIVSQENRLLCYKETLDTLSYLSYSPENLDSIIIGSEGQCFYAVVSNEEIEDNQKLTISPNPFNTNLTINASFKIIPEKIKIYDIIGRNIPFTIKKDSIINTTNWIKGIYYIVIEEKGNYIVEKVVKM